MTLTFSRTPVGLPLTVILLALTLVAVFLLTGFWAKKIVHAVEDIGDTYTELYKVQHREVMVALKGETARALADTKALVLEHTELERILRVLAQRDDLEQSRAEAEGSS